jgi:hypothetical protein
MNSLSEILHSLPSASLWSWWRGNGPREGRLSVYHDDFTADRRTVREVTFHTHCVRVETRILKSFDPEKNQWREFIPHEATRRELPDRKGEKRLREYIATAAKQETGYVNPGSVTIYNRKLTP